MTSQGDFGTQYVIAKSEGLQGYFNAMVKRKERRRKPKSIPYSDETLQAIETIIDRIEMLQRKEEDPQRSFEFVSQFLGKSSELDVAIAEGLAGIPSRKQRRS